MKLRNVTFGTAFDLLDETLENGAAAAEILARAVRDGSVKFPDDPDLVEVNYKPIRDIMLFEIVTADVPPKPDPEGVKRHRNGTVCLDPEACAELSE